MQISSGEVKGIPEIFTQLHQERSNNWFLILLLFETCYGICQVAAVGPPETYFHHTALLYSLLVYLYALGVTSATLSFAAELVNRDWNQQPVLYGVDIDTTTGKLPQLHQNQADDHTRPRGNCPERVDVAAPWAYQPLPVGNLRHA